MNRAYPPVAMAVPAIKRFYDKHVYRVEDEYEVYDPKVLDPKTRRCVVKHTGTLASCQTYFRTEGRENRRLRVRATGESTNGR